MGLLGPSRADQLEHELAIQRDVNWAHRRYIALLEALVAADNKEALERVKKAHQEAWEEAHRNPDGTLNFSRTVNERQYDSTLAKHGYYKPMRRE